MEILSAKLLLLDSTVVTAVVEGNQDGYLLLLQSHILRKWKGLKNDIIF